MGDEISYPAMIQDYLGYLKAKGTCDDSETGTRAKAMARKLATTRLFSAPEQQTLTLIHSTPDLMEALEHYEEADFAVAMLSAPLERHLVEEAANVHREGREGTALANAAVYALNEFIQSRRFPIDLDTYSDQACAAEEIRDTYDLEPGRKISYSWLGLLRYRRVAGLVAKPSSKLFLDAWRDGDLLTFATVNTLGEMSEPEFKKVEDCYRRIEVRSIGQFSSDVQRISMEKFING